MQHCFAPFFCTRLVWPVCEKSTHASGDLSTQIDWQVPDALEGKEGKKIQNCCLFVGLTNVGKFEGISIVVYLTQLSQTKKIKIEK